MRAIAARLVLLPLLISVAFGLPAYGQTSVDMRALDQATPRKPAPKAVKPEPSTTAAPPAARSAPTRDAAKPKPTGKPATATATKPTPSPPAIQAAAPPKLPIRAPDPAPATGKTPPPVLVAKPPEPVWLTFDSEKADIKPDAAAAITALVRAIPVHETVSVNVAAYAAGRSDDPSTARRLSLSRGMAVRAALIDGGIPSTQIYVRALGVAAPDGGAADRVLLSVARTGVVSAAPDAATSGPNRKGTP